MSSILADIRAAMEQLGPPPKPLNIVVHQAFAGVRRGETDRSTYFLIGPGERRRLEQECEPVIGDLGPRLTQPFIFETLGSVPIVEFESLDSDDFRRQEVIDLITADMAPLPPVRYSSSRA